MDRSSPPHKPDRVRLLRNEKWSLLLRIVANEKRPFTVAITLCGIFAAAFFGVQGRSPVEIATLEVVLLLLGTIAEIARDLLLEIRELSAEIRGDDALEALWHSDEAVACLRRMQRSPKRSVQAVWSPLQPSDAFKDYLAKQLEQLNPPSHHTLERIVDASRVPFGVLKAHLTEAVPYMQERKYRIELVPAADFGATIVDGEHAALNFTCSESLNEVIFLTNIGQGGTFVQRVARMIDELRHRGERQALGCSWGADALEVVVSEARQFYEAHGYPTEG